MHVTATARLETSINDTVVRARTHFFLIKGTCDLLFWVLGVNGVWGNKSERSSLTVVGAIIKNSTEHVVRWNSLFLEHIVMVWGCGAAAGVHLLVHTHLSQHARTAWPAPLGLYLGVLICFLTLILRPHLMTRLHLQHRLTSISPPPHTHPVPAGFEAGNRRRLRLWRGRLLQLDHTRRPHPVETVRQKAAANQITDANTPTKWQVIIHTFKTRRFYDMMTQKQTIRALDYVHFKVVPVWCNICAS